MSAAGSESSDSCVITQEATKTKRGLNTELNRPLLAIMNPELTMTLPPYQIACGATDILAHIMERYFTNEPDVRPDRPPLRGHDAGRHPRRARDGQRRRTTTTPPRS